MSIGEAGHEVARYREGAESNLDLGNTLDLNGTPSFSSATRSSPARSAPMS